MYIILLLSFIINLEYTWYTFQIYIGLWFFENKLYYESMKQHTISNYYKPNEFIRINLYKFIRTQVTYRNLKCSPIINDIIPQNDIFKILIIFKLYD